MSRSSQMTHLVENALQSMPQARRAPIQSVPTEVPVRSPRERSLVRSILQGDAVKADVKRFFRVRENGIPQSWDPESVIAVEQIMARDPGSRPGGFLGLLRFACDLREQETGESTWLESRLWSLLRRRLSTSSGLMLLRSVANSHDVLRSLVEDSDSMRRRGFVDLLRVLGTRTGQPFLEHPRTIDRAVWEFSLVMLVRADQYNAEFRGTGARQVRCLDLLFAATSVFVRDRGYEPSISDLRSAVLQIGAPLGPALDSWIRGLAGTPGQTLFPGLSFRDDPRDWVWETGRSLLDGEGLHDRNGKLAACERALLERARSQENWKEEVAYAVHEEFRAELERALPESRRESPGIVRASAMTAASVPAEAPASPVPSSTQTSLLASKGGQIAAAITAYDQEILPSETSEGLPTVGFGILDLERQGRWIAEGWRTGWTPTGHVWTDHFRSLLGDARVREFMRLDPDWMGGLRDLLTEPDPWLMAGWEDLVRWLYPAGSRHEPMEFRQNQRPGAPPHRTGWDWTVLRLFALTLAEVASSAREPGLAPSCLSVLLRWQYLSRGKGIPVRSMEWWAWLADEVDMRADLEGKRRFPRSIPQDDEWRMRNVAPWIAFPSPASASVLGAWVLDPVPAIHADPNPVHERWASRLSMLTQLQEEAKEESIKELSKKL